MTELIVTLSLLAALALLSLWWALRADRTAAGDISGDSNAEVFRQRLTELQQEREKGTLDDGNYAQLETDLKRQLLAETDGDAAVMSSANTVSNRSGSLLPLVLITVAVLSAFLYRQIGGWPDLRFHTLQQSFAGKQNFTEDDMRDLAQAIDTSLKFRSDNADLRFWRAQLAVEQGDFTQAVNNYRQLLAAQPGSAIVMAQLAQALFLQNGRKLDDESRELMRRAAELDATQTTALGMLGIDAFDRGDYAAAVDHWSLLLRNISPQAPQAEVIRHALERAKQMVSAEGALEDAVDSAVKGTVDEGEVEGIRVRISKGALDLPRSGVLYVFAKAAEGPGFPLAVVRTPQSANADWPQEFLLTPQDAMRPDMTLDQFESVRLTARFSQSGTVTAASGDVEGSSGALNWRDLDAPVELVLDTRIP